MRSHFCLELIMGLTGAHTSKKYCQKHWIFDLSPILPCKDHGQKKPQILKWCIQSTDACQPWNRMQISQHSRSCSSWALALGERTTVHTVHMFCKQIKLSCQFKQKKNIFLRNKHFTLKSLISSFIFHIYPSVPSPSGTPCPLSLFLGQNSVFLLFKSSRLSNLSSYLSLPLSFFAPSLPLVVCALADHGRQMTLPSLWNERERKRGRERARESTA